jgi:hypothetical protein
MSNQFQDQLGLLLKVNQLARASEQWTPDPDGADDDQGLDEYLGQIVDPDPPAPDAGPVHALRDSAQIGLCLANARLGILKSDHEAVHKNLNRAMAYHKRIHSALNAAASSELNPMRIRQEQEED